MKDFESRIQKLYDTIYHPKYPIWKLSWRLMRAIDFKWFNVKNIEWVEQRIKEVGNEIKNI